jgi:hypothetical protein
MIKKKSSQVRRDRVQDLQDKIIGERRYQSYQRYVITDGKRLLETAQRKLDEAWRRVELASGDLEAMKEKVAVAPDALQNSIRREKEMRAEISSVNGVPRVEVVKIKLEKLRAKIAALEAEVTKEK